MKRLTIVAMSLCLALALTVPAMALEADFSGEFRVRGFNHSNTNLTDAAAATNKSSDSFYDTRTRIKSIFKITDNISFTTQFDALERKWGTDNNDSNQANYQESDDIDFEHAYATIKTPIGGLLVGRLIGSQWGPSGIGDSNDKGKDRILLFVPVENWTFVAYTEKYKEYDTGSTVSDDDLDKYTALAKYKGENFEGGLLFTHYDFKDFPAMRDFLNFKGRVAAYQNALTAQTTAVGTYNGAYAGAYANMITAGFTALQASQIVQDAQAGGGIVLDGGVMDGTAAVLAGTPLVGTKTLAELHADSLAAQGNVAATGAAAQAGITNVEAKAYVVNPYVSGSFGDFSYFGELLYGFGDADVKAAGRNDIDLDVLTYHAEGKYSFGPASIRCGYWFLSGDNDTTDDELNAFSYIEPNKDLDIAFILTGSGEFAKAGLENSLGGLGNFSGAAQSTSGNVGTLATSGAKMIYVGVGFSPMENLELDFLYANAKADAAPGTKLYNPATQALWGANWDDEVGSEYDFTATWTPMDNLEYKFVAAFLDAGDYWKQGVANAKVDDNLTLYNSLTVSF